MFPFNREMVLGLAQFLRTTSVILFSSVLVGGFVLSPQIVEMSYFDVVILLVIAASCLAGHLALLFHVPAKQLLAEERDNASLASVPETDGGSGPFPPDGSQALTAQEMSEIYSKMQIEGGYKPHKMSDAD